MIDNNKLYSLSNGYYKCIGIDFYRKPDNFLDYYSQYVILARIAGEFVHEG